MTIYLYEEDSGEEREITAGSMAAALAEARTLLAEGVKRQFEDIRRRGRRMDLPEVTVSAEVTPELPDTTLDTDARQKIEVTLPVPADLFDEALYRQYLEIKNA